MYSIVVLVVQWNTLVFVAVQLSSMFDILEKVQYELVMSLGAVLEVTNAG